MRVLFVDDEPQVLRGLRRMLDASDETWLASFADSGEDALELMRAKPFDAIVTDIRMSDMTGAELLQRVSDEFPAVIRIVLSGQAKRETVFRVVRPMHQYLAKPCNAETLRRTLLRAKALRDVLDSPDLHRLVSKISTIPSVPTLYLKLVKSLQSDDVSIQAVGDIISQDAGMTAKMLKVVNSAVFGLPRAVSSPEQAVSLLGLEAIKALTLSVGVFEQFETSSSSFSIDRMFKHCIGVAQTASAISKSIPSGVEFASDAFTAGVLHDVGKLVLVSNSPDDFESALQLAAAEEIPAWQAEQKVFGATHAAIGAHLFGLWGLPQTIVETVALHHTPLAAEEESFSALSAVYLANLLSSGQVEGRELEECEQYLSSIGLADQLEEFQQIVAPKEELITSEENRS